MRLLGVLAAAVLLPVTVQASETGELLASHLYAGSIGAGQAALAAGKDAGEPEACFGWAMLGLAGALEGLAQDFYRYGGTAPDTPAAAMLLGIGEAEPPVVLNPAPEALRYPALRTVLSDFRTDLAAAQAAFVCGGADGADYVLPIDLLKARLDFNGDGTTAPEETLATVLLPLLGQDFVPDTAIAPLGKTKRKGPPVQDGTLGFDPADAIWLAGYTKLVGAQLDWLMAHDFEDFFNAYLHRVFPQADLPMQGMDGVGSLVMDPDSDASIADIIAGIHTLNFPVIDKALLASIPDQLKQVTALSRRNWELILAETDDDREVIPNPDQTSLLDGMPVTAAGVAAWRETLDVLDQIIDGQLLIPHWRFAQGFDLKAYFDSAERTDLVMLLAGQDALPFLKDGPIADAESFAAGNAAFGDAFPNYAFWFN